MEGMKTAFPSLKIRTSDSPKRPTQEKSLPVHLLHLLGVRSTGGLEVEENRHDGTHSGGHRQVHVKQRGEEKEGKQGNKTSKPKTGLIISSSNRREHPR